MSGPEWPRVVPSVPSPSLDYIELYIAPRSVDKTDKHIKPAVVISLVQ